MTTPSPEWEPETGMQERQHRTRSCVLQIDTFVAGLRVSLQKATELTWLMQRFFLLRESAGSTVGSRVQHDVF